MSKQALEILKSKMTLEERKKFVENCVKQNGEEWWKKLDGLSIKSLINLPNLSFWWENTPEKRVYWNEIYERFTDEELQTKIQL